jgi:hypothetical protein
MLNGFRTMVYWTTNVVTIGSTHNGAGLRRVPGIEGRPGARECVATRHGEQRLRETA